MIVRLQLAKEVFSLKDTYQDATVLMARPSSCPSLSTAQSLDLIYTPHQPLEPFHSSLTNRNDMPRHLKRTQIIGQTNV